MPAFGPRARAALAPALAAALALGALGTTGALRAEPAAAEPVADAQHAADAAQAALDTTSARFFAELDRTQALGTRIGLLQQQLTSSRARISALHDVVRRRVVAVYMSSDPNDLFAALDAGGVDAFSRATTLLAAANHRDDASISALRTATADLEAQEAALRSEQSARQRSLDSLGATRRTLDSRLTDALAARGAALAQLTAARAAAPTGVVAPTARPAAPAPAPAHTVLPPLGAAPPPVSPPAGLHDQPFLVCTRARESGGNYGAVNPSGPYLGAYQFLQSTWNVTAAHMGRGDLVGAPVNQASVGDQDAVAWALYQWQGSGPWGGLC